MKTAKFTAGILIFRLTNSFPEALLVHPGGPFYSKKDAGVWSVPKGEYDPAKEDALAVAKREFNEETGNVITTDKFIPLSPVKSSSKTMYTWAVEADYEVPFISSNLFELEWPPKSGKIQSFPETDNAEYFSLKEAKEKVFPYQIPLIEELERLLEGGDSVLFT